MTGVGKGEIVSVGNGATGQDPVYTGFHCVTVEGFKEQNNSENRPKSYTHLPYVRIMVC